MSKSTKLTLPAAILININIMLGAGIFINTINLAKLSGLLGAFVYAIIGIVMLPLVLTIAQLLKIYPGGNFYIFASKEINTTIGFFSSWAYFTAKLASSTLMIHFFSNIIHSLIPSFKTLNIFALDILILSIFTGLNMFNLKAGMKIQSVFMVLKAIPILFVILTGIFLFNTAYITPENMLFTGILPTIPLVVYAFTGFEAACSISRHIENPDKNAPKAILISYAIVIFLLCSYQFLFYSLLGPNLSSSATYFEAFPNLLNIIFPTNELLRFKLKAMLQLAVACSALGGAYGILYSNNWNLYVLAENNLLIFNKHLKKLNKYSIPFLCVLIEAIICLIYLFVSLGSPVQLQQIGALGSTIAYSFSAVALLYASIRNSVLKKFFWLAVLAIFNCLFLIGFCIRGLILNGLYPLLIFLLFVAIGFIMYFKNQRQSV